MSDKLGNQIKCSSTPEVRVFFQRETEQNLDLEIFSMTLVTLIAVYFFES